MARRPSRPFPRDAAATPDVSDATCAGAQKLCVICGRHMPDRAAAGARRCSQRCQRTRLTAVDRRLEARIVELLRARARGASICPSEAARAEFGDTAGLLAEAMQRTRRAARRLVASGTLDVLQGGRVVDASYARGPIRLRLTPKGSP